MRLCRVAQWKGAGGTKQRPARLALRGYRDVRAPTFCAIQPRATFPPPLSLVVAVLFHGIHPVWTERNTSESFLGQDSSMYRHCRRRRADMYVRCGRVSRRDVLVIMTQRASFTTVHRAASSFTECTDVRHRATALRIDTAMRRDVRRRASACFAYLNINIKSSIGVQEL